MPLTPAQKLTLRTHIQANTVQLAFAGGAAQINTVFAGASLNSGDAQLIAEWYNLAASPDYWVIRKDAPVAAVRNAIQGDRYTPSPGITGANAAQHTAASNQCMAKMEVLQFILPAGAGTFDATVATNTKSLKDSTTNLPSAGSFNLQDSNWTGAAGCIANILVKKCSNLESVFKLNASVATLNDGTTARGGWSEATGAGNPDTTSAYGQTVTGNDISDIHGLPA